MQAGVGLLDTDVMPMLMIIALDIVTTLRFSINCSTVIFSPTILFAILGEASSETYGPRVYFASCFPTIIYDIFMHNNAFWSSSNAFSLIICKVHTKRENTGSWNSGPEKLRQATYSTQLQMS